MKNTCKKISLAFIAILCLIFVISNTSQAAVTSTPLPLDGTWTSASITSASEPVYYSIILPNDGTLNLICQSELSASGWGLYSEDLVDEYFSESINGGSENSPVAKSQEYTLKAGTYILKLYSPSDYYLGNMNVKGEFEKVTANDIEPNDTFSQAMSLNTNQEIEGYIASNDKDDYFKINIPKAGTVEFSITTSLYLFDMDIYNAKQEKIKSNQFYTYGDTETNTVRLTVTADTYYVKISNFYSTRYGGYRFQCNANYATDIQITPSTLSMDTNDLEDLTVTAIPANAILPDLKWSSSNTNVATVSNGTVRTFDPGVTTITATATDGSNISGSCTVIVIPDEVNFFDKAQTPTSITLKWGDIEGADGYRVYKYNSSSKKYVKYKDTSKTSLKVTKLKTEKKYKFKVIAYIKVNGQKVLGVDAGGKGFWTAPKKLKASKITSITKYSSDSRYTYINVQWKKVKGATGYQVYGKVPGGNWEFMGSTKKLKMKLYAGRGYTYSIRVRPYRKKHGLITYGNWSKTKKYTSR